MKVDTSFSELNFNDGLQEKTRSLCPECGSVIDAQIILRDGKAFLRKHCAEHGVSEVLF